MTKKTIEKYIKDIDILQRDKKRIEREIERYKKAVMEYLIMENKEFHEVDDIKATHVIDDHFIFNRESFNAEYPGIYEKFKTKPQHREYLTVR